MNDLGANNYNSQQETAGGAISNYLAFTLLVNILHFLINLM